MCVYSFMMPSHFTYQQLMCRNCDDIWLIFASSVFSSCFPPIPLSSILIFLLCGEAVGGGLKVEWNKVEEDKVERDKAEGG